MKVLDYKKFSVSKLIYNSPLKSKGGCLLSKMNYSYNNEEIPIYIQTPKLKVACDLVNNDARSFLELEIDKEHIHFYEFINNIDDKNIESVHSKSEVWFDKKIPMDVIDDFYTTPIKMRKLNRTPTTKFKIPLLKNNKGCDLFGEDSNPITFDLIKKNVEVICILELVGIKFYKQRFECEWNVVQLRAYTNQSLERECMINDSFLSDNEDIEENVFKINDINSSSPELENNDNLLKDEDNIKNIKINLNGKEDENNQEHKEESSKNTYKNEESIVLHISKENTKTEEDISKNQENQENYENQENQEILENIETNTEQVEVNINTEETDNNNLELNNVEVNSNENTLEQLDGKEELSGSDYNSETESEIEIDTEESDIEMDEDLNNELNEDEELLCEGLDDNLSEIVLDNKNEIESETVDLENIPDSNINNLTTKNDEKHNISDLMAEIEKLKRLAFEKDEEVINLKNKYRNLYSELNI